MREHLTEIKVNELYTLMSLVGSIIKNIDAYFEDNISKSNFDDFISFSDESDKTGDATLRYLAERYSVGNFFHVATYLVHYFKDEMVWFVSLNTDCSILYKNDGSTVDLSGLVDIEWLDDVYKDEPFFIRQVKEPDAILSRLESLGIEGLTSKMDALQFITDHALKQWKLLAVYQVAKNKSDGVVK